MLYTVTYNVTALQVVIQYNSSHMGYVGSGLSENSLATMHYN